MNGHSLSMVQSLFSLEGFGKKRLHILLMVIFAVSIVLALLVASFLLDENDFQTNFDKRSLPPSFEHPFGTDWLGRDMLMRTVKGLSISLGIGMTSALASAIIAVFLGLSAATMGRGIDSLVTFLIDSIMGVPHMVLLILISYSVGGGTRGVILAVGLTHWTTLARIVRAETFQIRTSEYVGVSRKMGRGPGWIAFHHILPNLLPQFIVGILLLFPHAIMHAAGLTFLGFGISPQTPAIGILLSESMRYLSSGYYWLALFPGVSLVLFVKLFDMMGMGLRTVLDPKTSQE